jgi:putative GTP pyrophosphokinase
MTLIYTGKENKTTGIVRDTEKFYGKYYYTLKETENWLVDTIRRHTKETQTADDMQQIQYCSSRIKSAGSMIAKLQKKGLRPDAENALSEIHDAVGVRMICPFNDDIYAAAEWLRSLPGIRTVQLKDYVKHPKASGYRSYHMILFIPKRHEGQVCGGRYQGKEGVFAEVQIRTIAMDFWACLDHQLSYKKDNSTSQELLRAELKSCADEITSVDLSMQTLRDLIRRSSEMSA